MSDDKVWLEARRLDRYKLSDEQTNNIAAGIVKERAAWARLVRSERAAAREERWFAPEVTSELDAARRALRDLGVDLDALLGER